jgi:hypothetical protein
MSGQSALKGFRTQTLYIIHRAISSPDRGYTFKPEGLEDLDIQDNSGTVIEVVQIKNLSSSLTFSDLGNHTKGKTSFFKRSELLARTESCPQLTVVSFGEIGPELSGHTSENTNRLESKLIQSGISKIEAQKISRHTTFQKVDEEAIKLGIKNLINAHEIAIDPEIAIDYLHAIVQYYSEIGKRFSKTDLLKLLDKVGTFVANRAFNLKHLHSTIRVFSDALDETIDIADLQEQYKEGAAARFEHILANLDIIRQVKIDEIHARFGKAKTVVIHGASGQGKTSLALRYIKQFNPWRTYKADISTSPSEAAEQIQALAVLVKPLEIPILVYMDVEPGNENWTKVLTDLNYLKNIRFLVTIRTEDWNRSSGAGVSFKSENIELVFDEHEAREFYELSEKHKIDALNINFEEAWEKFEEKGPLLEFNYLLRRGQSLRERLGQQIKRIAQVESSQEGLLDFLFVVCFADSNGCQLPTSKVRGHFIGSFYSKALALFNKEHLVNESADGTYISGLHPIRSGLIVEILLREYGRTAIEGFKEACKIIEEKDVFKFLTKSFLRFPTIYDSPQFLTSLPKFSSWTGHRNCLLALIWLGCYSFSRKYSQAFEEGYKRDPSLTFFMWHLDVTGMLAPTGHESVPAFQRAMDWFGEIVRKHGMNKQEYFIYARQWIIEAADSLTFPTHCSRFDLGHLGEMLYWIRFFGLPKDYTPSIDSILQASKEADLESIATILLGLNEINGYPADQLDEIRQVFTEKLQRERKIVFLEIENGTVIAHYLIDVLEREKEGKQESGYANSLSVEIVRLLRLGFSHLETFGAKAYGHGIAVKLIGYDDSVKSIPKKNLPLEFLPVINSISGNLALWQFRPDDWMSFAEIDLRRREDFLEKLLELQEDLHLYFKAKRTTVALQELVRRVGSKSYSIAENTNSFPKSIVDELGMISESTDSRFRVLSDNPFDKKEGESESRIAYHGFSKFQKVQSDYFRTVSNFLDQAPAAARLIATKNDTDAQQKAHIAKCNIQGAFLQCTAYQKEFAQLFGKYFDLGRLRQIESKEKKALLNLLTLWEAYCNPKRHADPKFVVDGERRLETHKKAFELHTTENLKKLSKKFDAKFGVHFRPECKCLLVTIDTSTPSRTFEYLFAAYEALRSEQLGPHPYELKTTMLNLNYQKHSSRTASYS